MTPLDFLAGLAAPVVEAHGSVSCVRDDLLPGGSKTRFLPFLIPPGTSEVVFGGPFCGGAPVALSVLGQSIGLRVSLFYAARKHLHPRQIAAQAHGAVLHEVPFGYMSNVQAKARAYAQAAGSFFLPLGFDIPAAEDPFVEVMRSVRASVGSPEQVWCATGSGMLARCLGRAFPDSEIRAVAVGLRSRWSRQEFPANVKVTPASLPFEREARGVAPFPTCPNYDLKAWLRCAEEGRGSRLFWNVLG